MIGWLLWALVITTQTFCNTWVSRARNQNSLKRHTYAAVAQAGVYIGQQMVMLGNFFEALTGKHGHWVQFYTGVFFMLFSVAGALASHRWCLHTEGA